MRATHTELTSSSTAKGGVGAKSRNKRRVVTHTKPLSQTIVKDKTHHARSGQATPFSTRLESTTKMNCHITHLLRRVKTAPGREPTTSTFLHNQAAFLNEERRDLRNNKPSHPGS